MKTLEYSDVRSKGKNLDTTIRVYCWTANSRAPIWESSETDEGVFQDPTGSLEEIVRDDILRDMESSPNVDTWTLWFGLIPVRSLLPSRRTPEPRITFKLVTIWPTGSIEWHTSSLPAKEERLLKRAYSRIVELNDLRYSE